MVKYKLESKQYKNIVNIIKDEASEKMDGIKNTFYEKRSEMLKINSKQITIWL